MTCQCSHSNFCAGKLATNSPRRAIQVRKAIERLGPAYVKVAQAVSTRVDVLDMSYLLEIERLQDRVPPFPTNAALPVMAKGQFLECAAYMPSVTASCLSDWRAAITCKSSMFNADLVSCMPCVHKAKGRIGIAAGLWTAKTQPHLLVRHATQFCTLKLRLGS